MKNITEFINESLVVNETMKTKGNELFDNIIKLVSDWGYDCDVEDLHNLIMKVPTKVNFNTFITMDDNEDVIDEYNNYVKNAKLLGEATSYNITISIYKTKDLYIVGVSDDNDGFAMSIGKTN